MRIIGITGGIGGGKSQILAYIEQNYRVRVISADEVANLLKKRGQPCYKPLIQLLGSDILLKDGEISKEKMAEKIFADQALLAQINQLLHPAVKEYILNQIAMERSAGETDILFIEAALLIEEHYEQIADELWYIYADREHRRQRLRQGRNYSEEKINQIMSTQLEDEEFRKYCKVIIDNNGDIAKTYWQIDEKMGEYSCRKK